MDETTTIRYRGSFTRKWRRLKEYFVQRLLKWLGVHDELAMLRRLVVEQRVHLSEAEEALLAVAAPELPQEFFDDTEILITEKMK